MSSLSYFPPLLKKRMSTGQRDALVKKEKEEQAVTVKTFFEEFTMKEEEEAFRVKEEEENEEEGEMTVSLKEEEEGDKEETGDLNTNLNGAEMNAFCTILAALTMISCVLGDNSGQYSYGSDITEAANFAIAFHNRMNKYAFAYKVVDILSATPQIYPPARVKHTMTVKVGQTVCKNEANVNLADCSLQNSLDLKTMICHFVVLEVPHSAFPTPSYLLVDQCN
ncbi:uncharacterized protein isoform X2 [Salmo salar]|uniref:Uncharacterized protein isoform X2 n=1 Tax=Salmo salar TaxID=8030 RepID=A0A1S3L812_SALSA|nr:uncharacterized protein LOC106564776 isoform X2 [Salmo salar]|eukprot:XP_013986614.1 PREDICTED: uncharacterized protein LOC106564776 isoform X3 [Salmo salar]